MILFKFVQETNNDTCFKCKKLITSIKELSIEHKLPWEGRSVELFWDLNNIAFSHLRCNRPHRSTKGIKHGPHPRRKIGPEGTAWCVGHKLFLPVENFSKGGERWDGIKTYCKECRNKGNKKSLNF